MLYRIKHDLETRVVDLEAQVAEYEGEMLGKGMHLHHARQKVMSVEEELALAKIQMQKMASQIDSLEITVKEQKKTILDYKDENERLKAAEAVFMKEKEDSLRANHTLEVSFISVFIERGLGENSFF
jgi:chromosome segregation ATPase